MLSLIYNLQPVVILCASVVLPGLTAPVSSIVCSHCSTKKPESHVVFSHPSSLPHHFHALILIPWLLLLVLWKSLSLPVLWCWGKIAEIFFPVGNREKKWENLIINIPSATSGIPSVCLTILFKCCATTFGPPGMLLSSLRASALGLDIYTPFWSAASPLMPSKYMW